MTVSYLSSKRVAYIYIYILGVVKRNPLFLHEIEWKKGFFFTTPNINIYTEFVRNTEYILVHTKFSAVRTRKKRTTQIDSHETIY